MTLYCTDGLKLNTKILVYLCKIEFMQYGTDLIYVLLGYYFIVHVIPGVLNLSAKLD
jgi:hypothetical protein